MKGVKTGGRKKGTPNKVVGEGRKYLAEFLEKYFSEGFDSADGEHVSFEEDITSTKLTNLQRMSIIKDVMQYVYPKMQSASLEATVNTSDPLTDRLMELTDDEGQTE